MKPIKINEIEGLWEFLSSVDWTEPWFSGLGIFHVTCAILTVMTRRTGVLQAVYFGMLMLLVFCAEHINTWAAANWHMFARQQYFDSNGLFISLVFSVPVLVNCMVIVVSWLFDVGVLISNVKQLKIRKISSKKAEGEAETKTSKQTVAEGDDKEETETKKDK